MKEVEAVQYERGLYYLNQAAFLTGQQDLLLQTRSALAGAGDRFYDLLSALNVCVFEERADDALLSDAYRWVQRVSHPARLLKICHQAARLSFQTADYEKAIDFIRIALEQKTSIRVDLQYKIRLLQLDVHQKLENLTLANLWHCRPVALPGAISFILCQGSMRP